MCWPSPSVCLYVCKNRQRMCYGTVQCDGQTHMRRHARHNILGVPSFACTHTLRFDADEDCDDVTVKHEPAAGGAVVHPPSVKPLHAPPPSSQTRKRHCNAGNDASHSPTGAAAAVKAEPASVAIGPRAFKHQCPYCSYGSEKNCNVVKHVRVHTGEKPFKVRCCSAAVHCSDWH